MRTTVYWSVGAPTYRAFKKQITGPGKALPESSPLAHSCCSIGSSFLATALSHPFDVTKTILQNQVLPLISPPPPPPPPQPQPQPQPPSSTPNLPLIGYALAPLLGLSRLPIQHLPREWRARPRRGFRSAVCSHGFMAARVLVDI